MANERCSAIQYMARFTAPLRQVIGNVTKHWRIVKKILCHQGSIVNRTSNKQTLVNFYNFVTLPKARVQKIMTGFLLSRLSENTLSPVSTLRS